MEELKKLRIRQVRGKGRTDLFDYKLTFSTLSEVIERVIGFNRQHNGNRNYDHRYGGILIEAKDSQMYRDLYDGIEIGEKILEVLKKHSL